MTKKKFDDDAHGSVPMTSRDGGGNSLSGTDATRPVKRAHSSAARQCNTYKRAYRPPCVNRALMIGWLTSATVFSKSDTNGRRSTDVDRVWSSGDDDGREDRDIGRPPRGGVGVAAATRSAEGRVHGTSS